MRGEVDDFLLQRFAGLFSVGEGGGWVLQLKLCGIDKRTRGVLQSITEFTKLDTSKNQLENASII